MTQDLALSDWLQTTLAFQGLSRDQIDAVVAIAQRQTYGKGEVIFKQGNEATGFFLVKSGRIKVFNVSPMGKEQILNIFEAGDNFAEVAALDGKSFPASAAALEVSELLFFARLSFLSLLRDTPDIAINMLISLCQHTRHLARVIDNLSFKDVPQRLAAYLLQLSEEALEGEGDRRVMPLAITLDLTKNQLAAMLGTIPATLSRAFYRLSNDGIIAVNGAEVVVLDRDRLFDLSQVVPEPQDT